MIAATTSFHLPSSEEKPQYVLGLFQRLAKTYDLMNDLMTGGMHRLWKQDACKRLRLPTNGLALDLCCGTGDLALRLKKQHPDAMIFGLDFSDNMLKIAQKRAQEEAADIHFQQGDALNLPFGNHQFDAVVMGYGLRNVGNYDKAIEEVARVLKPGGRFVILDMSHPIAPIRWLSSLYRFHILPWVGKFIAKDEEAYHYLTHSIFIYLDQKQLCQKLIDSGFQDVGYRNIMGGVCATHWGTKN